MHAIQGSGRQPDRLHRSGLVHDLLRDWRRWTKAERVAAAALLAIIFFGTSVFIIAALAGKPI
jgi:hypothetical protein